jgi:regulator of protease activity HflC (stomatin/prohibitin superfamily)
MPSDQDESRALWQDEEEQEWEFLDPAGGSPVAGTLPAEEDQSSLPEEIDTDDLPEPDTTSDLLPWNRAPLLSKETLRTVARQFSPVLVPLPFALLVFLFTLPATFQGPPAHPSVLVMGTLLVALTILQGALLYFAGSNDTLWILYIAGGYALFIVLGVFAVFGPGAALLALGILALLTLIAAQRGIRPIREGYVDLVEAFGKYTHTLHPGLNLLMPWEKVSLRLNTQESTWTCPQQRVPTSREQDVQLTATISYQLLPEDAYLAALTVKDWEASLQALFTGTIQSVVNELTPGDFVTWTQSAYVRASSDADIFNPTTTATRWDRINTMLSRRMQDRVAAWGVQINGVQIQDITLLPNASAIPDKRGAGDTGGTTEMIRPEPVRQEKAETAQRAPQAAAPSSGGKLPEVETLKYMYNAIRQNTITDPAMILDTARQFERLANDPVASKNIDFDAARAATTLRQRAQKMQEQAQTRARQAQKQEG